MRVTYKIIVDVNRMYVLFIIYILLLRIVEKGKRAFFICPFIYVLTASVWFIWDSAMCKIPVYSISTINAISSQVLDI